ncbi:MAG TPA: FAD-binding protein [Noviherbaspirillum sp.]|nr:FAD-binding protein [Noviherbaspirillum sp.]
MNTPHPEQDGCARIEAPIVVDNEGSIVWDAECDVLVLGFGASGACAALEAASRGADVILCDRFGGGGASAKSGGVVYAGGGTRPQMQAGVEDTPQAMFEYLRMEAGQVVSDDTLRNFCSDSATMIDWLSAHGLEYEGSMPPFKTSYPPDGYYLYYSGNEAVREYAAGAAAAPRGHRTKGSGQSGAVLFEGLRRAVQKAKIKVRTECSGRCLVTDRQGKVLGMQMAQMTGWAAGLHRAFAGFAERIHNAAPGLADAVRTRISRLEARYARPLFIRARNRVVLATGGFVFNRAMMRQHAVRYLPAWRLGTTGCDGSGIRLGQSAGAAIAQMQNVSAWRFINPPLPWARGMAVDCSGRRFCNEEVYGARLGHMMCEKAGGRAWLILDGRLRKEAISQCLRGGLWLFQSGPALMLMLLGAVRAGSPEDLARRLRMPAEALRETLRAYNAAARAETEDPLGKSQAMMAELDEHSLFAIDISMDSRIFPCPVITLGGLRVDERSGAVIRPDGTSIEGLYAAGRTAVGIPSNHYVSGLSLADCIWSGRRAGRVDAVIE